jgi:chitinase
MCDTNVCSPVPRRLFALAILVAPLGCGRGLVIEMGGDVSPGPGAPPAASPASPRSPGAPLGKRLLVGYWHNFDNGSGFIKLRDVSPAWNVIDLSFGAPTSDAQVIAFSPYKYPSPDSFKGDVAFVQGRGQKVVLSIGGANGHVQLRTPDERQSFVDSVIGIVSRYGLDGIDIDFEGQSLYLDPGDADLTAPKTAVLTNLISAVRAIHDRFGPGFLVTMAPETFFVQAGYDTYGGRAGAYLPVIHALRDILTFLQVQQYNSGPVLGLDGQFHNMGSPGFHVMLADLVLTGFPAGRNPKNTFPPLAPEQVVIGLPASVNAGNGFTEVAEVQRQVRCLVTGTGCSGYQPHATYPGLRGLMSWSVNWDAFNHQEFSTAHRSFLDAL